MNRLIDLVKLLLDLVMERSVSDGEMLLAVLAPIVWSLALVHTTALYTTLPDRSSAKGYTHTRHTTLDTHAHID